jgi:antirestriction protein ArdC
VYANTYTTTETHEDGEEVEKRVPFLKTYIVFNVEQIDSLPGHVYAPCISRRTTTSASRRRKASAAATGTTVRHGRTHAYYDPSDDRVQMPRFETFRNGESYYDTLAQAVTHWTGHPSRVNREFGRKRVGDEGYAMEELVAELGAAFLCADLGITPEPREETAAYIQSWRRC